METLSGSLLSSMGSLGTCVGSIDVRDANGLKALFNALQPPAHLQQTRALPLKQWDAPQAHANPSPSQVPAHVLLAHAAGDSRRTSESASGRLAGGGFLLPMSQGVTLGTAALYADYERNAPNGQRAPLGEFVQELCLITGGQPSGEQALMVNSTTSRRSRRGEQVAESVSLPPLLFLIRRFRAATASPNFLRMECD